MSAYQPYHCRNEETYFTGYPTAQFEFRCAPNQSMCTLPIRSHQNSDQHHSNLQMIYPQYHFCAPQERQMLRRDSSCDPGRPQMMHAYNQPQTVSLAQTYNPSFDHSNYSSDLYCSPLASEECSTGSSDNGYYEGYCHRIWHADQVETMCLETTPSVASMTLADRGAEEEEEEEAYHDKPYAQLIYQALLDAPGYRMLLRDIYEWFLQNTRKPKASGTSGWQNSIRHNLSMNQAFENEKHDSSCKNGARRANSVWILTQNAIENGVQSTTRYRKTVACKTGSNRPPAIQRQRSGARGGRAARRSAKLKRRQRNTYEESKQTLSARKHDSVPHGFSVSPHPATVRSQWLPSDYGPATPYDEDVPPLPYSYVDTAFYCGAKHGIDAKQEEF